jgi:hypothetical protein
MNWETGSHSSEVSTFTGLDVTDGKSKFLRRLRGNLDIPDSKGQVEDNHNRNPKPNPNRNI